MVLSASGIKLKRFCPNIVEKPAKSPLSRESRIPLCSPCKVESLDPPSRLPRYDLTKVRHSPGFPSCSSSFLLLSPLHSIAIHKKAATITVAAWQHWGIRTGVLVWLFRICRQIFQHSKNAGDWPRNN